MGKTVVLKNDKGQTVELDCNFNLNEGTQGDVLHPFTAELNLSGNLSPFFKQVFGDEGLYFLYGKKAKDMQEDLKNAVLLLGSNFNGDPWAAHAGNAGHYLELLYQWSLEKPECTFKVY